MKCYGGFDRVLERGGRLELCLVRGEGPCEGKKKEDSEGDVGCIYGQWMQAKMSKTPIESCGFRHLLTASSSYLTSPYT